jgi:hypothetical protein
VFVHETDVLYTNPPLHVKAVRIRTTGV